MNVETARRIVKETEKTDYVSIDVNVEGEVNVLLDGLFTIKQLQAIVAVMADRQRKTA